MKRRLFVVFGVCAALCLGASAAYGFDADSDPDDSQAGFSTSCPAGGNLKVDPIGAYGVAQSMHMHSFAGQQMMPFFEATSHPSRLQQNLKPSWLTTDGDASRCPAITPDGSGDTFYDKSEYWVPALLSTLPHPVQFYAPAKALIYYRDAGVTPDDITPFPTGLSMVAGHANGTNSDFEIQWSCVAGKDDDGTSHELNFGLTIPATCPQTVDGNQAYEGIDAGKNYQLRLVVYFPNCINPNDHSSPAGAGQWVPGSPHYAEYLTEERVWGERTCAPFGEDYVAIPQAQVGFRWSLKDMAIPAVTIPPSTPG